GDVWKVNHASPLEAPKAYPLRTGYGLYVKADAPRDIVRFSESAASRETQSLIGEAGFLPVNGDRTISGSVDPEGTCYKVELTDAYGLDSILFYKRFAESNGIRFAFPQIDGLLDDEVEKTVNVLLFSPVIDAVDQLAQYVTESTELRTEPVLVSAFQNTLSVRTKVSVVRLSEHEAERETLHSRTIRSNFELVTGKILSVLDLFNEDVPANGLFDIDGISAIRESITSGDREFGLKRILESLAEGEDVSFEFDEQGVRIYTDETSDPAEIRYEDRLEDVAVYRKYVTDDPVYDGAYEKDAVLPVLVRRENGRGEVVKKTDHSFIDATFYCNENSDTVRRIADDVMERLRVMTDTISETKENPFLYNAVLTLYEMKNAIFAGKRSPYYVSVQKYIYNFPDAPSFEDAYLKTVDLLRKPESLEIRENLFLPYMSEQGILPEKAWYGFVTWYYDAEGGFLGEM
ncbi:MAG: hypothetical protein IK088_06685, partial [Lachnospiraceae bacterium]|nr:hypothetical protein [Lachnospiraceae bacterium]